MDKKYQFELATSSALFIATMNFDDSCKDIANPIGKRNNLLTTGDRVKLMDFLEEQGFYIVPKETLESIRTTLNDFGQSGSETEYDLADEQINKINKFIGNE